MEQEVLQAEREVVAAVELAQAGPEALLEQVIWDAFAIFDGIFRAG
jgi:hypothetical protein